MLTPEAIKIIPADDQAPKKTDGVPVMPRLAEFKEICDRFEAHYAETRRAIYEVLRIPVTPAFIIAVTIGVLAKMGILPKELAIGATALDFLWAWIKIRSAYHKHSLANIGVDCARNQAQTSLAGASGREAFHLSNILQEHPNLKTALESLEFQQERERRERDVAAASTIN